ncbi:signal peptide peptidase-like 2B isoform X1 [Dreissena polymorpha]|uniref:PA domain-containing protein n=1 Tax=Dreissena polymorpha TaxID=45954 RepID=A0A9D4C2M4_DREPO|nr:signal peptide peptidase-like 2B isoform X1 [Dreissena polymorpha]KAH3716201.1 hypothetical protein DPMN_058920 [Dreissena polymorpha]
MLRLQFMLIAVVLWVTGGRCDLGLMSTKLESQDEWKESFCIAYNPQFQPIAKDKSTSPALLVVDLSNALMYGCFESDYDGHDVTDAIVIVARGLCTFSDKAQLAEKARAKSLIVASDDLITPGANQTSDLDKINISVSTMLWSDVKQLEKNGAGHPQVGVLYELVLSRFDVNLVVIFLIAVSNIIIGGYWSGIARQEKYELYLKNALSKQGNTQNNAVSEEGNTSNHNDDSVSLSYIALAIGFVLVCGFLLLLYFFYSYLVYVVIAMFCIATSIGLYYCLKPILHRICSWEGNLPENRIPIFKTRPMYKDLILLALCCGLAVFWAVMRHAPFAWVIQDILGYAFCINVMRTVFVPNIKICSIMLIMLFIYDIFFVFISPLFTKDGKSIMVKVATGGSDESGGNSYSGKTQEMLPMVFALPKMSISDIGTCPLGMSLLGFGDVIIPGLLICHNHAFDLRVKSRRAYYITTCIGYGVGLLLTFVALALMETGQPALLYLVPCTLIPTFALGLFRKEVKLLWNGVPYESKPAVSDQAASAPAMAINTGSIDSGNSDTSIESETRVLISK